MEQSQHPQSRSRLSQSVSTTYPFSQHTLQDKGIKKNVYYERQGHLVPGQSTIVPKEAYEFRSTRLNAQDGLYKETLFDPKSTLKATGSMSVLPKDYFQRYIPGYQNAAIVLKDDYVPYLNNPHFYSQSQNQDKSTRFLMQKWSEQQLALKLKKPLEEVMGTQQYTGGIYANYHSPNSFEQTYQPKDQRYNKNYDEIGFGIKKVKLNEDSKV